MFQSYHEGNPTKNILGHKILLSYNKRLILFVKGSDLALHPG
jgi:hypothetical protein